MSDNIYNELILDLYRHPLNKTKPEIFDKNYPGFNASCGDKVELYIKWNGNKVENIGWEGSGCAITEVSTSLLTDFIKNKTRDEIRNLTEKDLLKLLHIEDLNPSRMRCATLSLKALKKGIE